MQSYQSAIIKWILTIIRRIEKNSKIYLKEMIEMQIEDMKGRTQSGYDIKGYRFADYKPKTIQRRAKRGLPTDHVTLLFTGAMQGDLTGKVERTGDIIKGTVYFTDDFERFIMRVHNEGLGNNPKREWFGIDETEISFFKTFLHKTDFLKGD